MPAHVKGFVGRERRTKIMARSFQLNGPIGQQNQWYLLRFRHIGTDRIPMRICARPSERLDRFRRNRLLAHHRPRPEPSTEGDPTSCHSQSPEEISPRQRPLCHTHTETSDVQTISGGSESVNLLLGSTPSGGLKNS